MSWAKVLSDSQVKALACLYSSAAPSAGATGIWLGTIQALGKLGLVEAWDKGHIESNTNVHVTPEGFRAWADILEFKQTEVPFEDICVALYVKRAQWEAVGPVEGQVASAMLTAVRAMATRLGIHVDWDTVRVRGERATDSVTIEASKP